MTLTALPDGSFTVATPDGETISATTTLVSPTELISQFSTGRHESTVIPMGSKLHVYTGGGHYTLNRPQAASEDGGVAAASADSLVSPMPATVIDVRVKEGDAVVSGQVLAVLESMKMEISMRAGRDGVVGKVAVNKGATVEEGTMLVSLQPETEPEN